MFNKRDKKSEEQNGVNNNTCKEELENNNEAGINEELEATGENIEIEEVANSEELLKTLVETIKEENNKLTEENSRIQNELETLKDRLARTVAEYDNFRKRTAKEKEGIYTDACEDVLKEMLPVLDNLERAMSVEGSIDDLKKGVEMTVKQFNNALEKLNVEEISTDSEFDPHLHNAVMHIDDEQYEKNQIVEVFQKGYKKGDKILRYSMVKVAN